jgi:hypothetical protein
MNTGQRITLMRQSFDLSMTVIDQVITRVNELDEINRRM